MPFDNTNIQPFKAPAFDVPGNFQKYQKMYQGANAPEVLGKNAGLSAQINQGNIGKLSSALDLWKSNQLGNVGRKQAAGLFNNTTQKFNINQGDLRRQQSYLESVFGRAAEQAAADTTFNKNQRLFISQLLQNQLGGIGVNVSAARRTENWNRQNLISEASARGASRSLGLEQSKQNEQEILNEALMRAYYESGTAQTTAARENYGLDKAIADTERDLRGKRAQTDEEKAGLDTRLKLNALGYNDDTINYITGVVKQNIEDAAAAGGHKLNIKLADSKIQDLIYQMFANNQGLQGQSNMWAMNATAAAQRQQQDDAYARYLMGVGTDQTTSEILEDERLMAQNKGMGRSIPDRFVGWTQQYLPAWLGGTG